MDDNICTCTHRITWEEAERLGEDFNEYMKYQLAGSLGELIAKRHEPKTRIMTAWAGQIREIEKEQIIHKSEVFKEFELQVAVLAPQRYKELLEKEYRLERLEK